MIEVDFLGPVVILASGAIGAVAEKFQQEWMQFLQKRVGITATMLSAMKGVKMTGLTPILGKYIQGLRVGEIEIAAKFRRCLVGFVGLGRNSDPIFLSQFAIRNDRASSLPDI